MLSACYCPISNADAGEVAEEVGDGVGVGKKITFRLKRINLIQQIGLYFTKQTIAPEMQGGCIPRG